MYCWNNKQEATPGPPQRNILYTSKRLLALEDPTICLILPAGEHKQKEKHEIPSVRTETGSAGFQGLLKGSSSAEAPGEAGHTRATRK